MSHHQRDFAGQLRQLGYRLTAQRQVVLDVLCDIGRHATASELYDHVHAHTPAIDRATVYRSLHLFRTLGLVDSAEINNQTVFEIAHPDPHHHLVCTVCGSETAIENDDFAPLIAHLATTHGFHADLRHLTIHGICQTCHAAQA